MDLPSVDEVISFFNSSTQASSIKQKMNAFNSKGFTQEQLHQLAKFRQELLAKLAQINQLEFNVLSAVAQAVKFVPFHTGELQEYIDENEDYDDIIELVYNGSAAFTAEGIIDRCIATIAESLSIEDFDSEFVNDNRDDIIEECVESDGCDCIEDMLKYGVYSNPAYFVGHWVRIAIAEYLRDTADNDDDYDETGNWFDEQESVLLEPYYQIMRKLVELSVF